MALAACALALDETAALVTEEAATPGKVAASVTKEGVTLVPYFKKRSDSLYNYYGHELGS